MSSTSSFTRVPFAVDLIRFPNLQTRDPARAAAAAKQGILIGSMHRMPYFLDLDTAINPHIFVCGITGSGKTYLMRSLMLKLAKIANAVILLIDFAGEYRRFVELAGETGTEAERVSRELLEKESGIIYLDLRGCGNQKLRVSMADAVLNLIIEEMRKHESAGKRVFIMLDEAWKLLGGSKALQTLLREGRKYGYGLIFSSQLVEDIDLAILSNAATLLIFRLQDRQGLSRLGANYGFTANQLDAIQRLGVGSCIALQSLASGKREFCRIEKVHGIEIDESIVLKSGGEMRLEIGREKLENAMGEACKAGDLSEALRAGDNGGYVDLAAVIAFLLNRGTDSRRLLKALRKLGIDEDALADSFAVAVSSGSNK